MPTVLDTGNTNVGLDYVDEYQKAREQALREATLANQQNEFSANYAQRGQAQAAGQAQAQQEMALRAAALHQSGQQAQQEFGLKRDQFGLQSSQDAANNDYRDRALDQTGQYQQGELANRTAALQQAGAQFDQTNDRQNRALDQQDAINQRGWDYKDKEFAERQQALADAAHEKAQAQQQHAYSTQVAQPDLEQAHFRMQQAYRTGDPTAIAAAENDYAQLSKYHALKAATLGTGAQMDENGFPIPGIMKDEAADSGVQAAGAPAPTSPDAIAAAENAANQRKQKEQAIGDQRRADELKLQQQGAHDREAQRLMGVHDKDGFYAFHSAVENSGLPPDQKADLIRNSPTQQEIRDHAGNLDEMNGNPVKQSAYLEHEIAAVKGDPTLFPNNPQIQKEVGDIAAQIMATDRAKAEEKGAVLLPGGAEEQSAHARAMQQWAKQQKSALGADAKGKLPFDSKVMTQFLSERYQGAKSGADQVRAAELQKANQAKDALAQQDALHAQATADKWYSPLTVLSHDPYVGNIVQGARAANRLNLAGGLHAAIFGE